MHMDFPKICVSTGVPPFFDLFQDHLLFQTSNGRCHRSSSSWFTTSVTGNNSVRKPERIGNLGDAKVPQSQGGMGPVFVKSVQNEEH